LADGRPQRALVDVLGAEPPGVRRRALARVRAYAVDARPPVLTLMSRTIVDVLFAVGPAETGRAITGICMLITLATLSAIQTWTGIAGNVLALAVLSCVAFVASARVAAVCVVALAVHARFVPALVLVVLAFGTRESWGTFALVFLPQRGALGPVPARLGRAVVFLLAVFPCVSRCARTLVGLQRPQRASAPVQARPPVTRVRDRYFTQRRTKSQRTQTRKTRRSPGRYPHLTRPAVLTPRSRSCMARIQMLAVLAHVLRRTVAEGVAFRRRYAGPPVLAWARRTRNETCCCVHQEEKQNRGRHYNP
jgi:hypothetical protein